MSPLPSTDIGVNLLHKQFDRDRDAVIERARDDGIERMLVTCTNLEESARGIEFCQTRDRFWCTAGVHPHDAKDARPGWLKRLAEMASNPEVKAVGEIGLDFNRNYSPPDVQITTFRAQLELAVKVEKPVFVHDRDSDGKVFDLLDERAGELSGVVVHCFTGTGTDLARYLNAGYYIGVTGWVCDPRRGRMLQDLVPDIPLDKLLVETDAPFLAPRNTSANTSKKGRNEPAFLKFIIEKIAELKQCDPSQIASATHRNASILFDLPEGV
ncbi:MAG: TatD family hydrolase [Gammaproteobacteria bacterium]|nr:TatD family hydrolase [Gammaproteobacteria bacterium]